MIAAAAERCNVLCILTRRACQRRRPPPLLRRPLLDLLLCPRVLAARSDRPLEYPENASDRVPLCCGVADRVLLPL